MWFKRKPRNRRLGREHVLDVKLRSSQVRAARTRMMAMGLGAVFALVFGAYVLWLGGEWALDRLVYENNAFSVEEIDVQTDGAMAVDQLRRWAGVKLGDNLLALDLGRVQRDLKLIPAVQSASVERILPHTLRIRVIEREPIAQIHVMRPQAKGGIELAVFYIDADGYVMLPLEPQQRATSAPPAAEPLPILDGIDANQVQPGRRLDAPQVQAALRLLMDFEGSPMAGLAELKRINVSATEVLLVETGQGSEVSFGLGELDQQLRRWRAVFDAGQKAGRAIASLDLAISNNIPVRWLEASVTVPPVIPKPTKHPNVRKRHHV